MGREIQRSGGIDPQCQRDRSGTHQLEGTFVAAFGSPDDAVANPFYNDPSLLCAPMFRSVETGVSLVNELAKEGGLLWPVDFTDQTRRPIVARRRCDGPIDRIVVRPGGPRGFSVERPRRFEKRSRRISETRSRMISMTWSKTTLSSFAE